MGAEQDELTVGRPTVNRVVKINLRKILDTIFGFSGFLEQVLRSLTPVRFAGLTNGLIPR
jgi:hypothetical protein